MSTSTKSSAASEKATQTTLEQTTDDLANLADARNQPLVIILAVTLPTLALIGLFIVLVVCYRRRHATIWLKKIEHSSRLQAIVVNISSTPIQTELPEKRNRLSHRPFCQPRTETIVYNRLSTPPTPVFVNPFNQLKPSIEVGQTNGAFDDNLSKPEQVPVLRSTVTRASNAEQPISTLHTDFPSSLQAPVRTITSLLVEAIAVHRLSLLLDATNTSSSSSSDTTTHTTNPRHSGASSSYSNSSQTIGVDETAIPTLMSTLDSTQSTGVLRQGLQ